MPMWTNNDGTNDDKPKFVRNNPVYDKNGDGEPLNDVLGADADEVAANDGIAHTGWVLKTEGTGGRAGRTQYEVLVALSNMTSETDHDEAILTPWGAGSSSSSSGTL